MTADKGSCQNSRPIVLLGSKLGTLVPNPFTNMTLSIKDPEADRLARALAQRTGETMTQAVVNALRERLTREERKEQTVESLVEDVMDIGRHCAALPLLDARHPDDIIGYDENGLAR
jgi:antitoxin VapB